MTLILSTRPTAGVHGYAGPDLAWRSTEKPGMALAPVRADRDNGKFLGYLSFDRFSKTGLHQHLGPAFSYFLQGGLSDYQGSARVGDVGINLAGATHSAIAYAPTLLASRLEAPVIYPAEGAEDAETLHTGAIGGEIVNPAPEVLPDLNIPLDALPWMGTMLPGVQRQMVFDYTPTAFMRRHLSLRLLPGTKLPEFRAGGLIDVFIIGGDVSVGGEHREGGDFLVIEPGARVALSTGFGALMLIWAEGPSDWLDAPRPDLFGFG